MFLLELSTFCMYIILEYFLLYFMRLFL
uniref:Uncharacterized protein n=1 Tax=Amphimedon queenslandica TaxID=400682 RepID=A0A1X7UUM9_AMPQE